MDESRTHFFNIPVTFPELHTEIRDNPVCVVEDPWILEELSDSYQLDQLEISFGEQTCNNGFQIGFLT